MFSMPWRVRGGLVSWVTFSVELVTGDLDAIVDKLGEIQKRCPGCNNCNITCRSAGAVRESAFEDARSGRAEGARQQVAQVAVRGKSQLWDRSAAARALGGAAGALGGASHRVGAQVGSPPVGPHFC